MTTYAFRSAPGQRLRATKRDGAVRLGTTDHPVRALEAHRFFTGVAGRPAHVHAVASGDAIYLQLNGRTCIIDRVDPTRSSADGAAGGAGASAPMPGVVISWIVEAGAQVQARDPLLVIESMKLQMTIDAPHAGTLEELPFRVGQTFARGDVLARIRAEEPSQ